MILDESQIQAYKRDGYYVARRLFSTDEVEHLRNHFMEMHEQRASKGESGEIDLDSPDPLKQYPRIMQPHRWDETSFNWLTDPRIDACMTAFLGKSPLAVQTMFYFKPPGSRGQALHQDQFYLHVQPGTCMAAWMAVDPCTKENGCLHAVPGTQDLPVLCTEPADTEISFTDVTVPIPEGKSAVPVLMDPGDVLFFNGSIVHGSYPNTSKDQFRRALIGHYAVGEAEKIGRFYHPVFQMDGTEIPLGVSEGGGPCGVWVKRNGTHIAELA